MLLFNFSCCSCYICERTTRRKTRKENQKCITMQQKQSGIPIDLSYGDQNAEFIIKRRREPPRYLEV